MRIAVMAGTPMDTKLGVDLLKENGFDQTISVPISNNPVRTNNFSILRGRRKRSVY